jgi:drug/metabolite transporter (DMT)-like permease
MPPLLWVPVTIAAAGFQVARNALQRGMMGAAGPWGATLVRFLFGLPFSVAFASIALTLTTGPRLTFTAAYWLAAMTGAVTQVLATASLLVAMRRAGFAVGTALQQSSLPLSAVVGLLVFHDALGPVAWAGVGVTSAGLAALTWPSADATGPRPVTGALFGLASGLCFGVSLNAIRHAGLALAPTRPAVSALVSVMVVQTAQAAALTAWLAVRDRAALWAVIAGWRQSLAAGFCGACASAGWFLALNLSAAAPVRAVGVVEAPIAALAGRRLFAERLGARQILAGLAVLAGVLMTTLG